MKRTVAAVAMVLGAATRVYAHRLDEYLQATTIAVERDRVRAEIRLTPGVSVLPVVLADIDRDADGVVSADERRAYAERVLRDLSLTIEGEQLPLRLVASRAAPVEEMREGLGDIELEAVADVPRGGRSRRLQLENRHQARIAAYLVNVLVPSDPDIRITAQNRNYDQSVYRLDYTDTGAPSGSRAPSRWSRGAGWMGSAAAAVLTPLALLWRRRRRRSGRL